jgi:hypothetical protein
MPLEATPSTTQAGKMSQERGEGMEIENNSSREVVHVSTFVSRHWQPLAVF